MNRKYILVPVLVFINFFISIPTRALDESLIKELNQKISFLQSRLESRYVSAGEKEKILAKIRNLSRKIRDIQYPEYAAQGDPYTTDNDYAEVVVGDVVEYDFDGGDDSE
jgi:hypothetical protein